MKKTSVFVMIISLCLCTFMAQAAAEQMVTLDFHDVDIKDMAKSMSQIVGKNFMMDDTINGKVTIISPKPVSIDEAYEAFLAALAMKGFTIVEKGVVSQIRKRSDAIRETDEVLEGYESVDSDRMVTRIIPIKYISANEIHKALKGLFSRAKARMVAYGPTNSLIVTDLSSNIRRLMNIVQKLDKPGFESTVEVVPLQFAQAAEVAQKLLQIFESTGSTKSSKKSSSSAFSSNVDQRADVSKIIPDERSNSLIVTSNRKGLERVLDLISQLDTKIASEMSRSRIHVRHLKHSNAEEVATLLSGILNGGTASSSKNKKGTKAPTKSPTSSTRSISTSKANVSSGLFQDEIRIGADPSTNSLVITATPGDFDALDPVIADLDRRRPQVFVEALIMEVKMGGGSNVGVSAHGAAPAGKNGGLVVSSSPNGSTLNKGEGGPFAGLLKGSGGLGLGFLTGNLNLGNGVSIPGIGGILEAIQENDNFNVLSSPNILTTDNQEAEIVVGQTVSVPKNTFDPSGNRIQDFDRQNANLELRVTPQINDGDEVTMKVEQTIKEPLRNKTNDLSNRSAKTTIVAQNGQTVVIGGLIKNKESSVNKKVPILGDVPIIGSLFKKTEKSEQKINLMIFLTPTILRDAKDMSRISVKKNNQRRKFNKTNGVKENQGLYDYGFNETMNMAPVENQEAKQQQPVREVPQKRFDYMNDDSFADQETPSQNGTLRGRYTTPAGEGVYANDRVPDEKGAQVDSAPASADNSNPFANVRPN